MPYTTSYMQIPKMEAKMARYPLNLPLQLKQEVERLAAEQGVSLNQFILWAVSEKVGALNQSLDVPSFSHITYRRGASGKPQPVLRGSGIRVQTVITASQVWGWSVEQIVDEYGVSKEQVHQALSFYAAHKQEIDMDLEAESALEAAVG